MSDRVVWTDQEKAEFLDRCWHVLQKDVFITKTMLVTEGMEVLPKKRRRSALVILQSSPWVFAWLQTKMDEALSNAVLVHGAAQAEEEIAGERKEMSEQLNRMSEELRQARSELKQALEQPEVHLGDFASEVIMAEAGRRLGMSLDQKQTAKVEAAKTVATHSPKPKKRRHVLIVGHINQQERDIREATKNLPVKLTFIQASTSQGPRQGELPGEYCIQGRFTDHRWKAVISNQFHSENRTYCRSGGTQEIVDAIVEAAKNG